MTIFWNSFSKLGDQGSTSEYFQDDITPSAILSHSLAPLLNLCKFIGTLPFAVSLDEKGSGQLEFGSVCCQLSTLCYFIHLAAFTGLTFVYSQFYLTIVESTVDDIVFQVAKFLFVCGQFAAAGLMLLLIPWLSRRLSFFFLKLQSLIVEICDLNTENPRSFYKETRRRSYYGLLFFAFITLTSWYLWFSSFSPFIKVYFESNSGDVLYYFVVAGCLLLASLISAHVVPSLLFFLILSLMKGSYKYISNLTSLTFKTGLDFTGEKERVMTAMGIFERLNELIKELGEIYGVCLIIEMCAFFTTILTNVFAILSGFQEGSVEWQVVVVSMIINLCWFYVLAESGEEMSKQQLRCLKALKNQSLFSKVPESWIVIKFLVTEPMGVSAANFFQISRNLITQVTGAIVMYLIVMLQFKSANNLVINGGICNFIPDMDKVVVNNTENQVEIYTK